MRDVHPPQQIAEARLGVQSPEARVIFHKRQPAILLLVSFLQPVQCFRLITCESV